MIARVTHLHDDRLYECYLAKAFGEPLDPSAADHLSDCDACRLRYAELAEFIETARADAEAESDEAFTVDRLQRQHDQIMRRLADVEAPARVIDFPGRVTRRIAGSSNRIAPRWLAAAAAAGLFVGVALGGSLDPSFRYLRGARPTAAAPVTRATTPPVVRAGGPVAPAVERVDDDAFLFELEFALQRRNTRELEPFDVLTPHVREVGSRVR